MGDIYQGIDFERMLSDLGQALERNKQDPEPKTAEAAAPTGGPSPDALNRIDQRRTQQGMAPLGAVGAPGGADPRTMGMLDPYTPDTPGAAPMSPQDQQTSAQLDAAAPGAIAFGGGHAAPPPMSPQDQQTLAQLSALEPGAVAFGGGQAPPPPPSPIGRQLATASAMPTAMSAPPTQYPSIDPNEHGGLAGFAALNR